MHPLLALLLACAPDPGPGAPVDSAADPGTCDAAAGGRQVWVLESLTFQRVSGEVSDGFDLDGETSTAGGATGCGIPDLVGPDGTPGIDNAFGRLVPALEATEFSAAEPLIDALIHSGELMILAEVAGLDDPVDDACVGLALRRATGEPLLGTDGAFLWGQTLEPDPGFADVEFAEQVLVGGSVSGRPLSFTLPLSILDADIEFPLKDGAVRLDLREDGSAAGVVAGGLDVAELVATAEAQGIAQDLKELLRTALFAAADLAPDAAGECQRVSITLAFTAVPVYVFDED